MIFKWKPILFCIEVDISGFLPNEQTSKYMNCWYMFVLH